MLWQFPKHHVRKCGNSAPRLLGGDGEAPLGPRFHALPPRTNPGTETSSHHSLSPSLCVRQHTPLEYVLSLYKPCALQLAVRLAVEFSRCIRQEAGHRSIKLSGNRNQVSGCLQPEGRGMARGNGITFGGDGVFFPDCGGDCTGVYICQNSLNSIGKRGFITCKESWKKERKRMERKKKEKE